MKRRSQTTKKQSINPTSALSPPPAKRSKKQQQMEIFNNTSSAARQMILFTFYQGESEGTTVVSERARGVFKRQLEASFSPSWSIRFDREVFNDKIYKMNLRSLMYIQNVQERQASVLFHLLKRTERSGSYGSGEVQFLIDHLCSGNRLLNNDRSVVHYGCLKMVEILKDMFVADGEDLLDEFDCPVNLWWKEPKKILPADTKVYGKKLTFSQKIEWFKYYENHWKVWNSNTAWFSFLWAMAGGFFFHQRFITARGKPMYHRFNERL